MMNNILRNIRGKISYVVDSIFIRNTPDDIAIEDITETTTDETTGENITINKRRYTWNNDTKTPNGVMYSGMYIETYEDGTMTAEGDCKSYNITKFHVGFEVVGGCDAFELGYLDAFDGKKKLKKERVKHSKLTDNNCRFMKPL